LEVTAPAEEVVYTYGGLFYDRVTVAVSTYGSGKIVAIADNDCLNSLFINRADNLVFGENIMRWLNNRRPVSIIDRPMNNTEYHAGDEIEFDGSSSFDPDQETITYLWRSSISGEIGSTESFTTELEPGVHVISLEVADTAGKMGESSISLRVLSPPKIKIDFPGPSALVSGVVDIIGSAWDVDGIVQNVEVRIDGGLWQNAVDISELDPWSNWTYTWDTGSSSDGLHRISIRSMDNESLNSSIENLDVEVDNTPPRIVEGPEVLDITSEQVTIEWRTNEPSSMELEYGTDSNYGQTISNHSYQKSHTILLTGLEPKTIYHYKLSSTDLAGNTLIAFEDLTFETGLPPDFTPPKAFISYPLNAETLVGEVLVETDVEDNYGILKVEFFVDDRLVYTDDSPDYYWLWDTTNGNYPDGQYTLKIVASDLSGNQASDEIVIEIDNVIIYPTFIRISASPNNAVSGDGTDILLTAKLNDPENRFERLTIDLSSIGGSTRQIMYDDGSHGDEVAGDLVYTFMSQVPEDIAAGEKILGFSVIHSGGETLDAEVSFFVNSPPPSEINDMALNNDQLFLGMIIMLMVVLLVTVIGGGVLLRARSRRRRLQLQHAVEVVPIYESEY
jgi:hypothetical protein